MSDDVRITVSVNNQTTAAFRDINGQLRTLDGRFAATSDSVRRSSSQMERGMVDMRATMLSLAPAAVPVAASLAPIAVHAGAAGLAVGAFAAALKPQITSLASAAQAQDKYTQAVTKYGQYSSQAAQAQAVVADTLKGMPQATQQAAAAYSNLRDEFHQFSDESAKFTMVPVEHSFAVLGALLPKLQPMVQGTATQLNRLVTVAGGAINTSGFDALSKKVSDFANASLKNATDSVIHFVRVLSEGNSSGPLQQFFAYAKEQGPAVKDTLENLARAVGNILQGAAQAGPGLLTLVDAFAKLVAAAPPQLIGTLMSVYSAIKLIKLAGAGMGAVAGGFETLAAKIATLRTASAGAGGGLAGLRAAFLALGTAAKASIIVAGIAAVVAVVSKLSNIGKSAPPDVDKLTTALAKLGDTGVVTGEAASKFGANFEKLRSQIDKVIDPSVVESINNWGAKVTGGLLKGGDASEEFTKSVDAIDTSLTNMVRGGKADLAKAALADMIKGMRPDEVAKFTSKLGDYKSALADQALEQKLAAQSMGLFGDQAIAVQKKLDAQKLAVQGLQQAILDLNDTNRAALDAESAYQQSLDDATAAIKGHQHALSFVNGQLDLNSKSARDAYGALSQLAANAEAASTATLQQTGSQDKANRVLIEAHGQLVTLGEKMGLSATDAGRLADSLDSIKDPKIQATVNMDKATSDLEAFNAAVKRAPGSKSVTLKTLSGTAEKVLESFGFKVTHLKDGSVKVSAATGAALSQIRNVQGAVNGLHGKTITVTTVFDQIGSASSTTADALRKQADRFSHAHGGLVRRASGGPVQHFDGGGYIQGPGTPTSDSIVASFASGAQARVSDSEYVVQASAVRKYGVKLLDALNAGRLKLAGFARGGLTQAQKDARSQLSGQMGISYFGRLAGYQRTPFERSLGAPSDLGSLVDALNQTKGSIRAATSGRTQSHLLKELDSVGKSLIKYDRSLNKVTASLDTAKTKLDDLKNSASQLSSSVSSNILQSSNITSGVSAGGTVTLASIMGTATQNRDKAQAFAGALAQLKAKGLDKGILSDIAQAGISGGGLETAGALLGASSSEISSLNTLRSQTVTYASQAGSTTADAFYGAAIKAQQALVSSLGKQQSKLEAAMANLAKVMEKSLSKAVKGKAAGGIVGAAASGGLRGGLTWVGEQGPELLDMPAGSRVWSNPDARRIAAAGAGRSEPAVLEIRSGGSEFDEFLLKVLRRVIRVRGGNVQVVLSGRP